MAFPLRKIGALAAKIGFNLGQEAQKQVSITLGFTMGEYNPTTDAAARVGGTTETVAAIEYKRKKGEGPGDKIADNRFAVETKVFMVQIATSPALLAGAQITRDTVIMQGAQKWEVIQAEIDPAGATWIIDVGI